MGRFTQYPAASTADYADATTFLIANEDGVIKQASLDGLMSNYGCDIRCASLVIANADVLQLYTTPQPIIAAQGTGTVIDVLSASVSIDYNSQDYATNLGIEIKTFGATDNQFESTNALNADTSVIRKMTVHDGSFSASDTQLIANSGVYVQALNGNPTDGDSDIEVFVLYRVINV